MSAIFGIWQINGDPVKKADLLKMQARMNHYGRDQQDIRLCQDIGMGCCLNQPDLLRKQDNPVYIDETGNMLVGDAQIYNRTELVSEYGLIDNDNTSTQALLLAAYLKWGDQCPRYLNGDFAFAVWEKPKKQLFIARDHLGVRPLFYFFNGSTFAFATDFRALLALPFVGKQMDELKLYAVLSNTYHIDPERSYFEQIKSLPQAHTVKIDSEKRIQKNKYWTPGAGKQILFKTEEEYVEALYKIVDDAIKRRVNYTEASISAELSGGLDSAVITILASRELKKADKRMGDLYSWSPPYDLLDKQPGDERELIDAVCRQEGLHCLFNDPREQLNQREAEQSLPPETLDIGSMLRRELHVMSARGVKYILSGWGGDDGISHRASLFELLLEGYWGYFLKQAWFLAEGSPLRFMKIIIGNTVMRMFRPFSYFGNANKGVPNIVDKAFARKMKKQCKEDVLYFAVNPVKYIESGAVQTRTELTAWLGAEYNVQYLYPFLDCQVIDFAMSIPRTLHYSRGINRYIFRKTFAGTLPQEYENYFTKNDIAKTTLHKSQAAENNLEKIKTDTGMLNRSLFSSYIDWDKLQDLIDHAQLDSKIYRLTKKKTRICINIQRILEETECSL